MAFSARCFTARAHNIPKDACEFRCADFPEGMPLSTRDDQAFLNLNGIQVQSAQTYNLIGRLPELLELGVEVLRLSPQASGTIEIIEIFRRACDGDLERQAALEALQRHAPQGFCNGFWTGGAGMAWEEAVGAA